MSIMSWTEKYRPKRIKDVIGNDDAKNKFIKWIEEWLKGKPSKKAVLLYGPPGVGKTTLVYAAANEYNLEVIETNASDVRSSKAIRERIYKALYEQPLFGYKGRIILFDEVDGINLNEDRGGLGIIIQIINKTRQPIVLTANDPWNPKLKPLRDICLSIRFRPLKVWDIVKVLRKICSKEKIIADNAVLREIAKRSGGDLRSAINDLQALGRARKITLEDLNILGLRDKQLDMFEITRIILTSNNINKVRAILSLPSLDYEMMIKYISENIPYQYEDSPKAIYQAYNILSEADILLNRAKRKSWSLLPYALNLIVTGIASIKKPSFKWVKYNFPIMIKYMSLSREKREKRERICAKIAKKCHISIKKANIEILPYIKIIYNENKSIGEKILSWLNIKEKEFLEI